MKNYWKEKIKSFLITPESGADICTVEIDSFNTVSLRFGSRFQMRFPLNDAIKVRDALAIGIIQTQDRMNYSQDHSRVTNGDMG